MLSSLQRISTKYYGSAFSQEEETGVYRTGCMVPRSPSELGSRYTILRLQQNSLPTRCAVGIHPRHRATSGPSQSARQECRPRSCCGRPGGRTPQLSAARRVSRSPSLTSVVPAPGEASGIKACFSGMEASFAYDTASCCLVDGDSQQGHSLPTVPGKMEPEFKPFPSPLLLQVPFSCQFLALASQREYCTHQ